MRTDKYKQNYNKARYYFEGKFSYDEKQMRKFLYSLGYYFIEYKHVKDGEKPDLYHNEIDHVFRREFEKNLLSLLINARDMIYVATQKASKDDNTL